MKRDFAAALEALQRLDRTRDDLKTGWSRSGGAHWAFTGDLQTLDSFENALRAIRFEPILDLDGSLLGVKLIDPPRSRGDERHLWSVLAPFVSSGSRLDWLVEDGSVERWRFEQGTLRVVSGSLTFDDDPV